MKKNKSTLPTNLNFENARMRVISSFLPNGSITWMFSSFVILFFSFFSIAFLYIIGNVDRSLFLILIATLTLLICMYSMIAGIFLFAHKNPFYQEWKDRLGYDDKN